MKHTHIYSIAVHYRKATVWTGSRMSSSRIGVSTCTPLPGKTREERHSIIAAWLFKNFGIPGPVYRAA